MSGQPLRPGQVYSQPAHTGSGLLENSQLATARASLKKEQGPVRLYDFSLKYDLPNLTDPNSSLFKRFARDERVLFDEKTGLYRYKPDFDIQTPPQLITFLSQKYTTDSERSGIKIAELKESYPNAKEAVEELSKRDPPEDREVLVIRAPKDGAPRTVFWNPMSGPQAKGVDEEFRELWSSLKTPDAVDRAKDLASQGLSTTSQAPSGSRGNFRGKRGGKGRGTGNRKFKIQNTHLQGVDLSKDFTG